MPWTDTTIHNIFNAFLRNQAFTSPGTIYLGLATALPTNAGSFTEVTTGQWPLYQRQEILIANAPTLRSCANSNEITFSLSAVIPGAPFTVTHGGIFSEPTGGIFMAWGPLATSLVVGNNSLVRIPVGSLTITDPGTLV